MQSRNLSVYRTPEVIPFTEDAFYRSLSNEYFSPRDVADYPRAKYLYRYLNELHAKTILIEFDYTDGDYLDDFSQYNVKCFADYRRRCNRLHFFSVPHTHACFPNSSFDPLHQTIVDLKGAYLGFVVARPLPEAIIGRTVLAHYPTAKSSGTRHYLAVKPYHANVFGVSLSVTSLAFQEQDTVLAACATVALWCCFHKTAELFGTRAPSPAAITRAANLVVHEARPIPSHGLAVMQICNAIGRADLEPEVIKVTPETPVLTMIYAHLKMGVPVILGVQIEGIGRHAMTVVGFSLSDTVQLAQEVSTSARASPLPMIGRRIDEFYAHDDQIGPFARIKVKPGVSVGRSGIDVREYPVTFEGDWMNNRTGGRYRLFPEVLIIPVYHKIRVTFLETLRWLHRFHGMVVSLLAPQAEIEWDVHLTTSNEFKIRVKRREDLDPDDVRRVLLRGHPRFIWSAGFRLGEKEEVQFLGDATDISRSFVLYGAIWRRGEFRRRMETVLRNARIEGLLREYLTEKFNHLLTESLSE